MMSYVRVVVEARICVGLHWSEDGEPAKDRLDRRKEGKMSAEDRQQCSTSRQLLRAACIVLTKTHVASDWDAMMLD